MAQNELQLLQPILLADTNKQDRHLLVGNIVTQITEGLVDPIKVHLQVKALEDVVKQFNANDVYKEHLLDAAEKNGKSFKYGNAEFSIKEMGVKYDYSNCNDPEYAEMIDKKSRLEQDIKDREAFLKTIPTTGIDLAFDDELITVYPPTKQSTTTVVVNLK